MNSLARIFRNTSQTPTREEAIQKLKETEKSLTKNVDFLERKIETELHKAKTHGTKNKPAALNDLKRKKRYEQHLVKLDAAVAQLEFKREALENEAVNAMIFTEQARMAAQQNLDNYEISQIYEEPQTVEEIEEALLKSTSDTGFDEDDLMAELEELEQEIIGEDLLEDPTAVKLPAVPVTEPTAATKASSENEENAMQELEAWAYS